MGKRALIVIPGEPRGKDRPRFARTSFGVRAYTSEATAEYESRIRAAYLEQEGAAQLDGAISVRIRGCFGVPKSASKVRREAMLSGRERHTKKVDCDNLAKVVLDALNGVAYDDDRQVCELAVRKEYSEDPRVEVELEEVGGEER